MLKSRHSSSLILAVFVALLLLSGCAPFTDQDQVATDPAATVTLTPSRNVGQTFVAQHSGLDGVEFSLRATGSTPVEVRAHLRADANSPDDLAVSAVTVSPGDVFSPHRFAFPPQSDSHNAYRYIVLSVSAGEVALEAAPGRAYLDGSLYVNGQPAEGQARFRLTYSVAPMLLETGRAGLDTLRMIALAGLIWALPGAALLSLCLSRPRWRSLSIPEKLTLSAGVGVALYPLLMLWAATLNIRLGAAILWAPPVVALLALVAQAILDRRANALPLAKTQSQSENSPGPVSDRAPSMRSARLPDALFAFALLAIFFTRLFVIRTLDGPSWGDAVQHGVMSQLMVEQGGLFSNWLPYAPYASLTIQFGFASNAAVLQHALGGNGAQAALVAGQLLNALAVLALYPLALRISGGNRWAGVAAVIVAGLFSPMPAFYVNWGRYAQLAGQAVLPVALWLLWEAGEHPRLRVGGSLAAGAALAGMMLCYYRMPYYYAAFVPVWLLFRGIPHWGRDGRLWLRGAARLATVALVAVILVLPWLGNVADSSLVDRVEGALARASQLAPVLLQFQQWRTVTQYAPVPLLIVAGIALLWAVARRKWTVVMIGPWALAMAALVAARLVKLPGASLLETFAVMILLYIPLGLLIGWLAGELLQAAANRSVATAALATAVALAAVAFGSLNLLRVVQPEFVLITRPDTRAMAWIAENTPKDAVFLAEGFRNYEGRRAVGADAGWWVPLFTRRANTMPPQYALLNEQPIDPGYSQRLVDLVAALETNAPGSDAGLAALRSMGVTHVYIGQTQGQTGMGVTQLYGPDDFLGDPHFTLVYHEDRVYIFALTPL